jgi:hypothetical protein
MLDAVTKKPLLVLFHERSQPYIRVPASQLNTVETLLKAHGIRCWPDENIISLNGGPAMGIMNIASNENTVKVQAILDSAP